MSQLEPMLTTAVFAHSEQLVLVTPPTSPTTIAGQDVEMFDQSAPKRKKSVCFHPAAKPHDGICERNQAFDVLVAAYFVQQREISELDVLGLTGADVVKLQHLHEDFLDLVERIEQSTDEGRNSAPILPRGGGLCMKLCLAHVPYIRILDRVVAAALQRTLRAAKQ
ncbi:hypothetical protein BASA81_012144 [Batrachochytrium salamandrivorans]|nr:hypothetical protein BASA81_012144 [Batrachochytrium salamandrivorans]